MTRYLLDANVFIQAKRLHYGFDFCPAFWEWLVQQHGAGVVASVEMVGDELLAGGDDLAEWTRARGRSFFVQADPQTLASIGTLNAWVNGQGYEQAAISTFFQVADYWLVAHALGHNMIVVTQEVASDSLRKVKIPNACIGVNVEWITPFQMLRREGARFVLPAALGAA